MFRQLKVSRNVHNIGKCSKIVFLRGNKILEVDGKRLCPGEETVGRKEVPVAKA